MSWAVACRMGSLERRRREWRVLSRQRAASGGGPFTPGPPLNRSVQQCPSTGSSLLGKGAQGTGLATQTWPRPRSEGLPHCTPPLRARQGPGADVSEKNGSFTSRPGPSAGAGSCLDVTLPRCLRSRPGPQPGWRLRRLSQGPAGAPVGSACGPGPGHLHSRCAEGRAAGPASSRTAVTAAGQGPAGPLDLPRPHLVVVQSGLFVQVPRTCRRRGPSSRTVAGGPGYAPPSRPASGLSGHLGVCELGGEGPLQAQGVVSGGRRARHLSP